jgi:hypothetical protein
MGFFDFWRTPKSARAPRTPQVGQYRIWIEGLESRVVPYAASGNAWPAPNLVTISFVPDGTVLGSNSNGYIYSNLFASFSKFGSPSVWENQILKAAQTWAQQTNLNFAVVADNGADVGSGNYQQGDPNMGDIRIGGYNFGTNVLAQAYMPPPVNNFSMAGDIQFNTGKTFNVGSTYDLFTVATHEIGHALGLYHSAYQSSAVMYPSYNGIKYSLTTDDINGIRSIYSGGQARTPDSFNGGSGTQSLLGGVLNTATDVVNGVTGLLGLSLLGSSSGSSGNGSFSSATSLNSYLDSNALSGALTGLNISTAGQAEYFSVNAPQTTSGTFTVTAQSSGLSLLNPTLTVYAADQATVLGTATGSGEFGSTLTLTLSNVAPGQQFYIKVAGADSSAFGTGTYGLALNFGTGVTPAIPLPNTQLLNGNPISSGGGQALNLMTAEGQVNTYTAGTQTADGARSVGIDANGNSVAVWSSYGQDGSGWGVYGQRFTPGGMPLGSEFRVNTTTAGDQNAPSVAVAADGSFMVVWTSSGQDGDGLGVYGRRYDANGNPLGGEFLVNTTTAGDQTHASVAVDAHDNFVVIWQGQSPQWWNGWDIYGQRFDASGARVGGEFQVNSFTSYDQKNPQVAMDATGDFVVVWQSAWEDGSGWGIYGQRYNSSGNRVGGEFRVNTTTAGDQVDPSVAMSATGGQFVVTWSSYGQDGSGWGVYGQRFFATGARSGQEFQVNVTTAGDQKSSSVTMDSQGNFLVSWQSYGQDGSGWGVYGRQYNGTVGQPATGEFLLSSTTAGDQTHPSFAMNDHGLAVAVWSGNSLFDSSGVVMQVFNVSAGNDLMDSSVDTFDVEDPAAPVQAQPAAGSDSTPAATPAAVQPAVATPALETQLAAGLAPAGGTVHHTRPVAVQSTPETAPGLTGHAAQDSGVTASHPIAVVAPLSAVPTGDSATGFTESVALSAGQFSGGLPLVSGLLPATAPGATPPVVLSALGGAVVARAEAEVTFATPAAEADAETLVRPAPTAPPAEVTAAAPRPRSERVPEAAPQTEAALWPRVCAECFTDVGWLEEGLAESARGSAVESQGGLSAALVIGLASAVAGSRTEDLLRADERRRPSIRPRN